MFIEVMEALHRPVDLIMLQQMAGRAGILRQDKVDGAQNFERAQGDVGEVAYRRRNKVQ